MWGRGGGDYRQTLHLLLLRRRWDVSSFSIASDLACRPPAHPRLEQKAHFTFINITFLLCGMHKTKVFSNQDLKVLWDTVPKQRLTLCSWHGRQACLAYETTHRSRGGPARPTNTPSSFRNLHNGPNIMLLYDIRPYSVLVRLSTHALVNNKTAAQPRYRSRISSLGICYTNEHVHDIV